jgi:hypothetical protein
MSVPKCPLCAGTSSPFFQDQYFRCYTCSGVFMDPCYFLSPDEEKSRYEEHLNDVEDTHFQQFVTPITDSVIGTYSTTASGLDFGSGNAPVISHVLEKNGYNMN